MGRAAIILILLLLFVGGVILAGYFYLDSKGYFDEPVQTPEIEKVSFFLQPIDLFTGEPITLNYKMIESQVVLKCLGDKVLENYKDTEQRIADKEKSLNQTEYEAFADAEMQNFYVTYPYLLGKKIRPDYCYVDGLAKTNSEEGTLIPGLNQFLLKKDTLYTFYYWKTGEYYLNKYTLLGVPIPQEINLSEFPEDLEKPKLNLVNRSIEKIYANPMAQNVNITVWGTIESNKTQTIRINVQGDNELRRLTICFGWTFGVLDIKTEFQDANIPVRLDKKTNRCFYTSSSLTQNNLFTRSYDIQVTTSQLVYGDNLEIYVLDGERFDHGDDYKFSVETSNGENIGANDFKKIIYLNEGVLS